MDITQLKQNVSLPDDPYYCGLRARIPNFAKSKSQKEKEANALYARLPAHERAAVVAAAAQALTSAAAGAGGPNPLGGPNPMGQWQGAAQGRGGYLDNGKDPSHLLSLGAGTAHNTDYTGLSEGADPRLCELLLCGLLGSSSRNLVVTTP